MNFTDVTPNLIVSDIDRSTAFYRDVLGFSVVDDGPRHGAVRVRVAAARRRQRVSQRRGRGAKEDLPAVAARSRRHDDHVHHAGSATTDEGVDALFGAVEAKATRADAAQGSVLRHARVRDRRSRRLRASSSRSERHDARGPGGGRRLLTLAADVGRRAQQPAPRRAGPRHARRRAPRRHAGAVRGVQGVRLVRAVAAGTRAIELPASLRPSPMAGGPVADPKDWVVHLPGGTTKPVSARPRTSIGRSAQPDRAGLRLSIVRAVAFAAAPPVSEGRARASRPTCRSADRTVSPRRRQVPGLPERIAEGSRQGREQDGVADSQNTGWHHPESDQQRGRRPVDPRGVVPRADGPVSLAGRRSYFEAVRSYPAGPTDEGCGLVTFFSGWVHQNLEDPSKNAFPDRRPRDLLRSPRRHVHAAVRPDARRWQGALGLPVLGVRPGTVRSRPHHAAASHLRGRHPRRRAATTAADASRPIACSGRHFTTIRAQSQPSSPFAFTAFTETTVPAVHVRAASPPACRRVVCCASGLSAGPYATM